MELVAQKQLEADQQVNKIFELGKTAEANTFNRAGGASWYFYNPQAISFGFNEFVKKWGERKLEDNWRRSTKASSFSSELEESDTDTLALTEEEIKDPVLAAQKKREHMLKGVPSTPEELDKSTTNICIIQYSIQIKCLLICRSIYTINS